jgi:hypothetical protein
VIVHGLITAVVDAVEGSPDLQRRLRALAVLVGIGGGTPSQSSASAAYLTVAAYSERASLSERTVWKYITAGLPTVGTGRGRRVDVERADEWRRRQGRQADAVVELDEARRRARKAATRVTGPK